MANNFKFTGEMYFPKPDAKRPFVRTFSKNNRKMASLNLGIKASNSNMAFVEMFGVKNNVIQTTNTDNERIEVNWEDRFDEDVVNSVAFYRKYTVDLGEGFDRRVFITEYDTIEYLKDNLGKYEGKVCITGQMNKEWYKDRYYDKFRVGNIYAVAPESKNKLEVSMDIYFDKDSIDESDFKKEKRIYLNAHILQYISKDEGNKFMPQQFVLDGNKLDFENETHVKLFDYRKKYMTTNKKTVVRMLWDITYINGADTVDFDESQLTTTQKEQVELGLATVDSFKPSGDIFGNRVNEFRLFKPNPIKDYANGIVDTEMKISEFEEQLYVPNAVEEKLADVIAKSKDEDVSESEELTVDEDDLFS